jgi:hypothetical protein
VSLSAFRAQRGLSVPPVARLPSRLRLLAWAFTLFSSVRMLAYLPTLYSIWDSGQSDQHSLFTWITWLGSNLTMAMWLHEHNGHRIDRAVLVNLGNAVMCAVTVALIVWFRVAGGAA